MIGLLALWACGCEQQGAENPTPGTDAATSPAKTTKAADTGAKAGEARLVRLRLPGMV